MKLIFGIGNPEQRYDGTRHNVGFLMLDILAQNLDASFKRSEKFRADIAEAVIEGEKVLLVKPTTYYNLVGEAARALLDFYKLAPSDILIIHDDLALPLGTVRTRIGGSDGGNNGLKSLGTHIGTGTARVRVGVWTETHHGADKASVVLGKFSRTEQSLVSAQEPTIAACIHNFIVGSFETTTHRYSLDTE